jgi:WD40 repeat protein
VSGGELVPFTAASEPQAVRAVAFDPLGRYVAFGTNARALRVCALRAGTVLHERRQQHLGSVYALACSEDGARIATASNDKMVRVSRLRIEPSVDADQDPADGADDPNPKFKISSAVQDDVLLSGHDGTVRAVCWTGHGVVVSAGAGDCAVRVWDLERREAVEAALRGRHEASVFEVRPLDDGRAGSGSLSVVTGGADGTARVWDLRTMGRGPALTVRCGCGVQAVATASRAGVGGSWHLLAGGLGDGSVALWDLRASGERGSGARGSRSRTVRRWRSHDKEVRSVDFSPDGSFLLSAGFDGRIVATDTLADLSGEGGDARIHGPSRTFEAHGDRVLQVRWHPRCAGTGASAHATFASCGADRTVRLWRPVG